MLTYSLARWLTRSLAYSLAYSLVRPRAEDEEHAVRDTDAIEAGFASVHVESPGFAEAQAYLSCVCQLAKEGCPSQEALNGLSEPYKLAFRRYTIPHSVNPHGA